jgi:hypothetical protein
MRGLIAALMLVLTGCAVADADLAEKEVAPTIGNIIALRPNQCLPTGTLVLLLRKQHGEKIISSGVIRAADVQLIMMLFTSESGSWTVTTTSQQGLTCILIWGENYTVDRPKKTEKGI